MRRGFGLAFLLWAGAAQAQDFSWRPAPAAPADPPARVVRLGRPEPQGGAAAPAPAPRVSLDRPAPIVRGQFPDAGAPPPPPPPFPGGGMPSTQPPGVVVPPFQDQSPYNCGVVNSNGDQGGFFSRLGHKLSRCWGDTTGAVGGMLQTTSGRTAFQSDHCFPDIPSPVTNPFYFEDPRALTQVRPVFIWQKTPDENPVFGGGNNFYYGLHGSVAFTDRLSLVVNKLGFTTLDPVNPFPGVEADTGFSEIHVGPKFTFVRNQQTKTLLAAGLTFELPLGSAEVAQDTGDLSLTPYLSFAQGLGGGPWTSFNFINTTGYSFAVDDQRTDFFFSSFHLDYNVARGNLLFPFVEANWVYYPNSGGARPLNFEGGNFVNFGSTGVAGRHELTVAAGLRVQFNQHIHFGLAGEFNVLPNDDGRHLDEFRLTADVIFRY